MGKYTGKAKSRGDFTVMEFSPQSSFGVRTRAKTLALQKLQNPSPSPSPEGSLSYLQLRSRRLEKLLQPMNKTKEACKETLRSSPIPNPSSSASAGTGTVLGSRTAELLARPTVPNSVAVVLLSSRSGGSLEKDGMGPPVNSSGFEVEVEVSFGENVLESEELNRNNRETTPTCLITDSEYLGTHGSSSRPCSSRSTNRRTRISVSRNITTTQEMEDFFAASEQAQRKLFKEKYNYDTVSDCPLPGRYEWIKLE